MSSFFCEECSAYCVDSPTGYYTGCIHYPADRKPKKEEMDELRELGFNVEYNVKIRTTQCGN